MRYFLTLLLIALVSSSEIIDKAQEINELAEYDDIELQFFPLIPILGKIVTAAIGIFAKAKAFIAGTKIFHAIKTAAGVAAKFIGKGKALILKGKSLIEHSKIFQTGKKIFQTGQNIYNKYKGMIQNSKLVQRFKTTYDKVKYTVEKSKVYQTYKKVKETYDKGKEVYDKVKDYYEKGKDFYEEYLKPKNSQNQEQPRPSSNSTATPTARPTARPTSRYTARPTSRYTARPTSKYTTRPTVRPTARPETLLKEKQEAFDKYSRLRGIPSMSLDQKKNLVNNRVNYMLARGFITPAQKQSMII